MDSASASHLLGELQGYGVAPDKVRLFGQQQPDPNLQDYLILNALRRDNLPAPDGVAEYQGRPILYFVDEQRLANSSAKPKQNLYDDEPDDLPVIFRQLACRGERAYLARVQFGKLVVAPVTLTERQPKWEEYTPDSTAGHFLFSRLAFGITAGEDFAAGDAVFGRLFALLKHAANKIAKNENLRPDALSLVGRALFFRFLRDRGVFKDYTVENIARKARDWSECFANPKNTFDTCAWLDRTFNGDFLPLSEDSEAFFHRIDAQTKGDVFQHLSAVIRGHEPSGNDYQPLLHWDWQAFDFAQVPVGLLSQVYEAFSWEWTPKEAKENSQHYTPRNIALTLVDEVFDKLPEVTRCRVLDPACGAGVFLVLAFRRLYLEHWKRAKKHERPGTEDIRRILENQLVGLDISESALKLAALSLYLTAIELDPAPTPPDKLRFKNLQGNVLHNVREPSVAKESAALGSLSPHLGPKFDGQFDVVVSNPPWTSVDRELGVRMASVCQQIIKRINSEKGKRYQLPDNNPDLPFLWKAKEWCKAGGRIAMALHARILLKTEPIPSAARETFFTLLQIDGIINGTNLADTPVWPRMNQPWMLLFATNKQPGPMHSTYFVTLPLELSLNKAGDYRIDAKSARPIDLALAAEKPWLWKALSVGTMLDVEVVEKIKAAGGRPLNEYWRSTVGRHRNGKGYTLGKPEQRTRDASHLKGLPNLNLTEVFTFAVEPSRLSLKFRFDKLQWPRRTTIYDPPLTLVKQAPGEDRENGRALIAFKRLAFNESFYGYSAAGHPHGESLVRYLHLFVHSNIWLYYLLLTSPEFGAERRRSRKADLEMFPLLPFEQLTKNQRDELSSLSNDLVGGTAVPWVAIDAFFARLYGLRDNDLQVIRDTLAVALPYETARQRACTPPTEPEKKAFVAAVRKSLEPFVRADNGKLVIERWKAPASWGRVSAPFEVLVMTSTKRTSADVAAVTGEALEKILALADETGAAQILFTDSTSLVVGIYNQYRYWTLARARLLSNEIIRYHLDTITG